MRLSNAPISLGLTTLGITSVIMGFSGALLIALIVYAIAFVTYLALKWRIMKQIGYFDNAWPLAVALTYLPEQRLANILTLALGLFGWGAVLSSVYIFLGLWIWFPNELPLLRSVPVVGALATVSSLWIADIILDSIIWLLFFGRTRRE